MLYFKGKAREAVSEAVEVDSELVFGTVFERQLFQKGFEVLLLPGLKQCRSPGFLFLRSTARESR
jgi:hypothetical protein